MLRRSNIQRVGENPQIRFLLRASAAEKREGNTGVTVVPAFRLVWRLLFKVIRKGMFIKVMERETT